MKRFILYIIILCFHLGAFAQSADTISVQEVRDIISVLASDSLKGRGLYNGGADMAAEYIQSQFNEIGLVPTPGATSYKQEFTVQKKSMSTHYAVLDGDTIRSPNIIVSTNKASLNWDQGMEDLKVVFIGPKDDILRKLEYVDDVKANRLVIIDKMLRRIFNRLGSGVSYDRYYMDSIYNPEEGYSTVFLLTEKIKFDRFQVHAESKSGELNAYNIIAVLPGESKKDEYVLFSAHYDGLGYIPADKGDTIANGADDGGSGTTALIALAKYYQQHGNERSLMFVAYSAQKTGMMGSQYFAANVKPSKIVANINIDMIGKGSQFGPRTAYITGYRESTLPKILRDHEPDNFKFKPSPYRDADLFSQSDNYPLAKLGVPAHTVSTFQVGNDPYLNGARDDMNTINAYIDNFTAIINAIAVSTQTLVSGVDTPTRIDVDKL